MAKNTRVLGVVVGVILLLAAGCGTVDANIHVTYTDGGNLQDELTVRCTGALASYVLTPEFKDSFSSNGWEVTTDVTNEATTFTARGSRKQAASPSASGVAGLADAFVVTEGGNPFVKTYTADFRTPAQDMTPPETGEGSEFFSQEDMEQMIETMFKMSVSVTLPGKIVESNADKVEGDTATWYYTYKGLQSERQLWVRSERTLWTNIVLAGSGAVLALGVIAYCAFRAGRSKTAPTSPTGDSQPDIGPA